MKELKKELAELKQKLAHYEDQDKKLRDLVEHWSEEPTSKLQSKELEKLLDTGDFTLTDEEWDNLYEDDF